MIRTALLLSTIIICSAGLAFVSLFSAVIGRITKRKQLRNVSVILLAISVGVFSTATVYASGRAALRIYATGQTLWRQTNEKVTEINQTIDEVLHPTTESKFRQITGYTWPVEAEIISTRDTYLLVEGEYEITFTAYPETLQSWITSPAPFDVDWQTGPPPPTQLGLRSHITGSSLGAENVWYAAQDYCCENGPPWHSGSLLVIDLNTNIVWLKIWDY
jgi:hypothetical protein